MKKINYHGKELYPIKSDIVFKVIFGKTENRDLLAEFLSAVLEIQVESPESIELKKVPLRWYNNKEMWSLFLATDNEEVIDMLANENKGIGKAVEKLVYVSADDKERFRIDQIEKARLDREIAMLNNYDAGVSDGKEQEKIEIAKSLLEVLDDEQISKSTGLSIEEVSALRNEQS